MDRDNLWSRRTQYAPRNAAQAIFLANTRSRTTRQSSDQHKQDSARPSASKRFSIGDSSARPGPGNGIAPLNTNVTAPPGASSAFGLGSGAFASFGSAAKTPKTPASAFDFKNSSIADSEKPQRLTSRSISQSFSKSAQDKVRDTKVPWPLKSAWVMWYRPPTSKNSDYEKSIKPVYKMTTAQEFWRVLTHLKRPSMLPIVSDYHFFKEGIRPVWEDEENKQGGKWILRLKKGVIDRYWEDILLALVGDQFYEAGDEVCGVVVSVRNGEDVLSVWTKFDSGRNVKVRLVCRALDDDAFHLYV